MRSQFCKELRSIDWRNDGNLIACGGYGGVRIYDARINQVVDKFTGIHKSNNVAPITINLMMLYTSIDFVRCVQWNKAGALLVSGSDEGVLSVVAFSSKNIFYQSSPLTSTQGSLF